MGIEMDSVIRVMQQQDKLLNVAKVGHDLIMKWSTDRIAQHDDGGGGTYGTTKLKARGKLALLQGASPAQIASEVANGDGYVLVLFFMNDSTQSKGWGHGVAAYVQGTSIIFFDPNVGEYRFTHAGGFKTWFEHKLIKPVYHVSNLDKAMIQHFT